jgi:Mg2+-importing ATPase
MVTSSNFGNVSSVLIASVWLPFIPMAGLQILVQNLLYDISRIVIPCDHMDAEFLAVPQRWDIWDLLRFIVILGPTSSTIDIATFCLNWFYYGLQSARDIQGVKVSQTHWFFQGLLTQTLVVHLLRAAKISIIQSRASKAVFFSKRVIMGIGFAILYIRPIADVLKLTKPGTTFIGFLAAELVLYCVEVELVRIR